MVKWYLYFLWLFYLFVGFNLSIIDKIYNRQNMFTKTVLVFSLMVGLAFALPTEDEVLIPMPKYNKRWYSGTCALIKDTSICQREGSTIPSLTRRETPTTTPSFFGSMADRDAPAWSEWCKSMDRSSAELRANNSTQMNMRGTEKPMYCTLSLPMAYFSDYSGWVQRMDRRSRPWRQQCCHL
jgi:hypothetical protein